MARVEDGNVFVACPGAPGWTTTGPGGAACWAEIDTDNKKIKTHVATISVRHERVFGQTPK